VMAGRRMLRLEEGSEVESSRTGFMAGSGIGSRRHRRTAMLGSSTQGHHSSDDVNVAAFGLRRWT
jgi:hypothetical protein